MRFFPAIILSVLFSLSAAEAVSQHTLVLDKPGRIKRLHFNPGDHIELKLESGMRISGTIHHIDSGRFTVNEYAVEVSEVKKVYKSRYFFSVAGPFSFLGGLIYGGTYTVNTAVINGENPLKRQSFIYPTGGLLAGGALMNYLAYRRYRIGRCCDLKTIYLGDFAKPRPQSDDEDKDEDE